MNSAFPDCKASPLNSSAHFVFAKHSQHEYLIRFSELNREVGGMIGRKTRAAEWRVEDCRDWPRGRRQHKQGLRRPEGLHMESENGSALTCLPRALSILAIPPERVGEAGPRHGHHSACLGRETEEPLLLPLELRNDRWRAICRA